MLSPAVRAAIVANQSADVAIIDPTALALLSIFGGAALTVIAGFVGAWLQSRREHQRWLREKRLEAFIALEEWVIRFEEAIAQFEKGKQAAESGSKGGKARLAASAATYKALKQDQPAAWARLGVLGPVEVDAALGELLPHVLAGDEVEIAKHFAAVERTMRRALNISD